MRAAGGFDKAADRLVFLQQLPDGTPTKATARGAIDRFTIWPTVRLTTPEVDLMVPPLRTPFRGRPQGSVAGKTGRGHGGGVPKTAGGVSHPPRPLFAVVVRRFVLRPADPNRASGEGKDGSDPPFLTAGAVRQEGGCPTQCPTGCPIPLPPVAPVCRYPCYMDSSIYPQGFHPSWKGEIRRSLLACGRNCASTCRVLTGTGTMTRGDEPTADLYSASEVETSVSGPP